MLWFQELIIHCTTKGIEYTIILQYLINQKCPALAKFDLTSNNQTIQSSNEPDPSLIHKEMKGVKDFRSSSEF
jgi:hypothetical protein